jgi:flagellar biosynthesis/type III secretory pathway chaperone
MEALIKNLETILDSELVLHEQLLEAAQTMNDAIKKEDLAGVRKTAGKHDELTCQIEAIEEKRLTANDALSRHLGVAHHANLFRIIELLPANLSAKLSDLRTRLKRTMGELKKTTTSNQILLNESLYTIAKTFELIDRVTAKPTGYKYRGQKAPATINRTIINTIA